ncbi:hypothetical protein XENOCAPTIV_016660, partial [Xenoophorus captivus]
SVGDGDGHRESDHVQQDHQPIAGGATLAFRDDKQETMVVRPYPQVQVHGQPQAAPQTVSIQPGTPVTLPAPAVHLPQGQPAVLNDGQMKVNMFCLSQLVFLSLSGELGGFLLPVFDNSIN